MIGLPPVCVLAGGLGTRLGEKSRRTPKAAIEVAGEPFFVHQLRSLRQHGATRIVMCLGYLGAQVEEALRRLDTSGVDVMCVYDSPSAKPIGTAGAVRGALHLLGDSFLVMYGDTFLRIDYRAVYRRFLEMKLPALMTVLHNRSRWAPSNASFDGRLVTAYGRQERNAALTWIDYGVSAMAREAMDGVDSVGQDLESCFAELARRRRLAGFAAEKRFYEIGTPERLFETERFLTRYYRRRGRQVGSI